MLPSENISTGYQILSYIVSKETISSNQLEAFVMEALNQNPGGSELYLIQNLSQGLDSNEINSYIRPLVGHVNIDIKEWIATKKDLKDIRSKFREALKNEDSKFDPEGHLRRTSNSTFRFIILDHMWRKIEKHIANWVKNVRASSVTLPQEEKELENTVPVGHVEPTKTEDSVSKKKTVIKERDLQKEVPEVHPDFIMEKKPQDPVVKPSTEHNVEIVPYVGLSNSLNSLKTSFHLENALNDTKWIDQVSEVINRNDNFFRENYTTFTIDGNEILAELLARFYELLSLNKSILDLTKAMRTDNIEQKKQIGTLIEQTAGLQKSVNEYKNELKIANEKLDYLQEREKEKQEQEEAKKARLEKRANAKKKPPRDKISFLEFIDILNFCSQQSKKYEVTRARIKVGFFLLYATGLRISNLLTLKTGVVKELFDSKEVQISINKNGPIRHNISIAFWLKEPKIQTLIIPEVEILINNQPRYDYPLFVGDLKVIENKKKKGEYKEGDEVKPVRREHLTREINLTLRKYSDNKSKVVRSHNGRISYVTDIYEASKDILKAKESVGNKTIQSTEVYVRSTLDETGRLNLQKNLMSYRTNPKKYYKKKSEQSESEQSESEPKEVNLMESEPTKNDPFESEQKEINLESEQNVVD